MTHLLQDVLRQPAELHRTLHSLVQPSSAVLQEAAETIRSAREVFLTGVGASWHAALCVQPLFAASGQRVHMQEAPELLHTGSFSPTSVVVLLSRSGKSVEVLSLLSKARESGATVIGITCSADGPLARDAKIPIVLGTKRDHAISVNTYSSLAAAAGALASCTGPGFDSRLVSALLSSVDHVARLLPEWQQQVENSRWPDIHAATYFLGRGCSFGTCHEARLLWEEGAKTPATAMGTGAFRHGPQEIVTAETQFGVWIDGNCMREQDLAVARDLEQLGAKVMLAGQRLPKSHGALRFELPDIPAEWQFLIDVIPAQLCAERLARRKGVDCDSFRICSYIVEGEYGLLTPEATGEKAKG
jgi:glucosamine--fructose-6-phosphate aminotransferase (isomerizing)